MLHGARKQLHLSHPSTNAGCTRSILTIQFAHSSASLKGSWVTIYKWFKLSEIHYNNKINIGFCGLNTIMVNLDYLLNEWIKHGGFQDSFAFTNLYIYPWNFIEIYITKISLHNLLNTFTLCIYLLNKLIEHWGFHCVHKPIRISLKFKVTTLQNQITEGSGVF